MVGGESNGELFDDLAVLNETKEVQQADNHQYSDESEHNAAPD